MGQFTQKELKKLVRLGIATDITEDSNQMKERDWVIIGFSRGKYGLNGCLIASKKGLYAITSRSSSLFYFV